jgi:arylsulfatase A-like enzyme
MDDSLPTMREASTSRRFRLLLILSVLSAAVLPVCLWNRQPSRPSVLLITIDTLRADHLGCYGYGRPTSPRIDRLAAEGALFERITTTLPRTTQSIASIMTGRYPKGHGARGLFSSLPETNLTLAEILKREGYRTAAVASNVFLRPGQGFEQGFEVYDNPPGRFDGDSAGEVTTRALGWLETVPSGSPFFLWVHYLDPHWTYRPFPPFARLFDPSFTGPFTLYEDLEAGRIGKGEVIFRNVLEPRQVEHVVALYDGEIAQVDAALGPLLEQVERLTGGRALVALTSDHGESLGEHGYHFAHGEYLYEQTLHVPLIVTLPGLITPGSRIRDLGQNIDVAPTILALLGISRLQAVDGRPLLIPAESTARSGSAAAREAPGRTLVFAESDFQLIHPENHRYYIPGPRGRWSSVSDGRYKLIQIPAPGQEILELYDLQEDPGETRNLEGSEGIAGLRSRLLRELRAYEDYEPGVGTISPGELGPAERERLRSLGYIN